MWTRLRHGQYLVSPDPDEYLRWRAEIVAHLREHRRPLVLSHAHAARAWGLPVPLAGWGTPTFTALGGSPRAGCPVIKVGPLTQDELVVMEKVTVTSLARTVVDCARTLPGPDGLAMTDSAMRRHRITRVDLERALARQRGWPGIPRARVVVALADPRRESPFESWSAWSFSENGVPRPAWQVEVCDRHGTFAGRVDCLWLEGVAGEADGRAKYRLAAQERGGADARTLGQVLDDERLREMALRRTGLAIVRWDPRDVLAPSRAADLARHITDQLAAASGAFTGRVHLP
jgi:hypothetical protein